MEEERIIDKLRKGEKVLCEICKNDYMDIKLNEKEKDALNDKINHPEQKVSCPRCGNELLYREYRSGCMAYCKTQNCIKGSIRGI